MSRVPGLRNLLILLLSLPAAGSAVIVLTVPPVSHVLPAAVAAALAPMADALFGLVARIPPGSLAGRLFHGSFAPLPALFGQGALAAHAVLLGLPWLLLAWWAGRATAYAPRRRRAA